MEFLYYLTQEIFGGGKLTKLANCDLPIFTDNMKMYLAYALTVVYLPQLSLPIALPVEFAKISSAKCFPCMVATLFK